MNRIKKFIFTNHLEEFLKKTNYVSIRIHHYTKLKKKDKYTHLNRALQLSTYCNDEAFHKLIKCINKLDPLITSKIITQFLLSLSRGVYVKKYMDLFSTDIITNIDINSIMLYTCRQGNILNIALYCSIFIVVQKMVALAWIECARQRGYHRICDILQAQYITPIKRIKIQR